MFANWQSETYFRHMLKEWWMIILFCASAFLSKGQHDSISAGDDIAVRSKSLLRWHGAPIFQSAEQTNEVNWKWEFIGPAIKPEELNPGGKAIPAYAANRGNGTGRINYLYMHPKDNDKLWACSPTGGLWYTRNGGKYWHEGGTDQLPISGVSSVAVNTENPRQWIIATGDGDDQFMFTDGVWMTKNGGKDYYSLNGDDPSTALPFVQEDSPTFIGEVVCKPEQFEYVFVASNKGLWVCEDIEAGQQKNWLRRIFRKRNQTSQKWKRVAEGQFYDIEIIERPDEVKLVIAAGEKLLVSYDGGASWKTYDAPQVKDANKFKFVRLSVEDSPALPNFLYVMVTCSEAASMSKIGQAALYLFDLKAGVWQKIRDMDGDVTNVIPTRARAFAVSPFDPNLVLCANVQPVNVSSDGGKSFRKIEKNQMHDDLHHFVFAPDGKTVWASHDGGVSKSDDAGLHWKSQDEGIGAANVFGVATSQTEDIHIAFGAYDTGGNMLRHAKWNHVSWGDGFESIISPSNPEIVFTTMQNGNIQATYNGNNFEEAVRTNSKTEWHTWIRMHPKDHNVIYCSGASLVRSKNLGKKWETIFNCDKIDSTLFSVYRFFLSPDHPDVMYVYALDDATAVNPQIWWTKNLREEDPEKIVWEKVPYIPREGWIMYIAIDPDDASKFWILYNRPEADGKIYYFDGRRYTDLSLNLGKGKCEIMTLQQGDSKRLYVGSNHGVFTMSKDDKQWIRLAGLPGTYIKSFDINYNTGHLVVGTFGRGVWRGPLFD